MEKLMVIIFNDETNAHHGIRALKKLDTEGSIAIHAGALIRKDEGGPVILPDSDMEDFPIRTLGGSMLGGVIGLLAGPAGFAAGTGLGAIAGLAADMAVATVDDDLVYEVSKELQPGKSAVILDVTEDWVTPVDTDLEPYTNTIFRRAKVDVEDDLTARRIEENQKEMETLEKEWSQAREDRKEKIHARMEDLKKRMQRQADHLKQRRKQIQEDNEAKIKSLQKKASTASSEMKNRIQSRMDELKRGDQEFLDRIDRSVAALQKADMEFQERVESRIAQGLRKAAEHIEPKKKAL